MENKRLKLDTPEFKIPTGKELRELQYKMVGQSVKQTNIDFQKFEKRKKVKRILYDVMLVALGAALCAIFEKII